MGDKLGNYKVVLILNLLLGAFIYLPVLWLQTEYYYSPPHNPLNLTNASSLDDEFNGQLESEATAFYLEPYIFPILLVS